MLSFEIPRSVIVMETGACPHSAVSFIRHFKKHNKTSLLGQKTRLVVFPGLSAGRPNRFFFQNGLIKTTGWRKAKKRFAAAVSFGTGTHETTALCIELIERYYRGGKLLDVGTGSGILAIAAALLGATDVVAVDIDPDAVRVAKENVEKNGLSDRIAVREGDLLQGLSERFDFAAANILAPVIQMLAAPLTRHLNPGGLFVCSGIIEEAAPDVEKALLDAGYEILESKTRGDWHAFAVRKN